MLGFATLVEESFTKSAKVSFSPSYAVISAAESIGVIAFELRPPAVVACIFVPFTVVVISLAGLPLPVKFLIYCSSCFCVSTILDITCSFYSSLYKRIYCSCFSFVSNCSTNFCWSIFISFMSDLALPVSINRLTPLSELFDLVDL